MKKNLFINIFLVLVLTFAAILPVTVSSQEPLGISLSCGSLYVKGTDDKAVVQASGSNNYDVEIEPNGEQVTFRVNYLMKNIDGWTDCAYVYLYYNGFIVNSAQCDTGSSSGTLTYSRYCYPDETVTLTLKCKYTYYNPWYVEIKASDTSQNTFVFTPPENNPPNTPSKPSGQTDVKIGLGFFVPSYRVCTYCSSTTDPDGDYVSLEFNYDGAGWIGPYPSGSQICTDITWDSVGTYFVNCQAKDDPQFGESLLSDISPSLRVVVEYWWSDFFVYTDITVIDITIQQAQAIVYYEGQHVVFQTENIAYEAFCVDRNADEIYDSIFVTYLLDDGEIALDLTNEYYLFYDEPTDSYIVDFNENHCIDSVESENSVSSDSFNICTDGNPFE